MRYPRLFSGLLSLALLLSVASAQAQTKRASGYHKKASPARSRTVARVSNTRRYSDEDRQRLAPGMRINMPTPPSTDYMGRPIKKKVAKPASTSSTISSEK
ncbi:hypothetical protein [Hymenobacter chitinivorans]|uniref:Secreted protein n=1 Tax=Hymenobacter chitinivorans DSM 11115 TaxID=1121954 RepID=A0A2M9B5I5_9BACT|nr:hypothetical protein [Hymenobacter chitinivorans]PJJ53200.1 hypothetical protein CLV45_3859 [Hymenobacter chitinivorans DSM 11115]